MCKQKGKKQKGTNNSHCFGNKQNKRETNNPRKQTEQEQNENSFNQKSSINKIIQTKGQ
jgi:hypothetical protein